MRLAGPKSLMRTDCFRGPSRSYGTAVQVPLTREVESEAGTLGEASSGRLNPVSRGTRARRVPRINVEIEIVQL